MKEEIMASLERALRAFLNEVGLPTVLRNFLRRVLFSAEINPRDPTSRGMSDTVNPFSSMSLTRGQYFRDLYSCIFSTFVSNGTDNSKIRISFSCSRNTHMSGQRFVVPHSIGIVEIPFF